MLEPPCINWISQQKNLRVVNKNENLYNLKEQEEWKAAYIGQQHLLNNKNVYRLPLLKADYFPVRYKEEYFKSERQLKYKGMRHPEQNKNELNNITAISDAKKSLTSLWFVKNIFNR